MNKKGFTLIELMAVIVILSVIALITTPIVINVISNVRNELSNEQKQIIENAARMWGVKNLSVDDNNQPIKNSEVINSIAINDLKYDGFLEKKDIKNINEDEMERAGVCISYDGNQFIYKFINDIDNCDS